MLVIFCLLILVGCGNKAKYYGSVISDIDLDGRLYPKVEKQVTSLTVLDLSNDNIESQVACIGLQGIVNRKYPEKLYVKNSRCKDNHGG